MFTFLTEIIFDGQFVYQGKLLKGNDCKVEFQMIETILKFGRRLYCIVDLFDQAHLT
jgi:hypothetical protein